MYRNALRCSRRSLGLPVRRCRTAGLWNSSSPLGCMQARWTSRGSTLGEAPDHVIPGADPKSSHPTSTPGFQAFRKSFEIPAASDIDEVAPGNVVTILGFLGKRRDKGAFVSFCHLDTDVADHLQIVSLCPEGMPEQAAHTHALFKSIPAYSAVAVTGRIEVRPGRESENIVTAGPDSEKLDLHLESIECIREFPKDIIVSKGAVWAPSDRHLQMRFDPLLRQRLQLRSRVASIARSVLESNLFVEVDTPVLFKSTPEGAREFLVPTRRPGFAYALPQSPQQYKQLLVAGGIRKYFQFARCFRDEDSRADRQPEFSQLDLEMGFATGKDVMRTVEELISSIFEYLHQSYTPREIDGILHEDHQSIIKRLGGDGRASSDDTNAAYASVEAPFPRIKYQTAMEEFGSDKPDLRIPSRIRCVDDLVTPAFVGMITHLENPTIEAAQFRLNGTPAENQAFIREFMDNLPKTLLNLGSESTPGIFVFDATKPLNGLSAFGHESADKLASMDHGDKWQQLEHGDIIVVHARKNEKFQGEGWTELGRLRKAIYDAAVQKGLMDKDVSYQVCWVTDFPLFTPDDVDGEGQGGMAGLKATHHPFTSPLSTEDFDLLETNPLEAKADHYDLVINGVEVGGGSRRIHVAEVQEYVMRDIIKMPQPAINQFSHLLDALRAGCPPHAGFALGYDRFISLLCDVESVRDVIAFPKSVKGEDLFVKSPSKMTADQMSTYHLAPKGYKI
ncbi:tRNA synthetases class II-domain-containing protein [Xylariales sp. PMI_506]|nr:tRNA synthetases class II-domain-containing protein [Xylariales sp. PMI_506]